MKTSSVLLLVIGVLACISSTPVQAQSVIAAAGDAIGGGIKYVADSLGDSIRKLGDLTGLTDIGDPFSNAVEAVGYGAKSAVKGTGDTIEGAEIVLKKLVGLAKK